MRDLVDIMKGGPGGDRDRAEKSDLVDVALLLRMETPKAYLLTDDVSDPKWVPKSLVEDNEDGTWAMPEWLAKDRGWI